MWKACLYLDSGEKGACGSVFGVMVRPTGICGAGALMLELDQREMKKGVFGAVADGNSCRVEGQSIGRDGSFGGLVSE